MYVSSALFPSLGRTTVLERGSPVRFVAVLELSEDNRYITDGWTVELWYGTSNEDWSAAPFLLESDPKAIIIAHTECPGVSKHVYTLNLNWKDSKPVKFTLRYKPKSATDWIWCQEQTGLSDGQIIFEPSLGSIRSTQVSFDALFQGLEERLSVKSISSQVSEVEVFDVSGVAPALEQSWSVLTLGLPLLLSNFYSIVKTSSPWMAPRQGTAPFMVDRDALMLGYLRSDGRHVVVLAVSGINDCTTFLRSAKGGILLKTRNDGESGQTCRVIVSTGFGDYKRVGDAAFYRAREILQSTTSTSLEFETASNDSDMHPLWREAWYDGLAYCTWNSLGSNLSEERILAALQDLSDNGLNISSIIIDDGWQSLDSHRQWTHFEANEKFPHGLAHTLAEIRRRFGSVRHIAVWHSIIGYWEGISPGSEIDSNYECSTVKWHGGADVRVVDAVDIDRFYNDFYFFLFRCGVTAVKCDVQASLDEFDDALVRRRLGFPYQDAFLKNSNRWFSRRVIYCMSHVPSIFFHSLLPHETRPALFRNSDDFFPDIPDSHTWHIFCNSINNIFTSHLNGLPDWDMFQSSLPEYGSLHAAGRCISGGPVYLTDEPGKHNIPLIRELSARSPAGHHVGLLASRVGMPVDPFLQFNHNQMNLLKVSSFFGGFGGTSLLAVFNLAKVHVTDVLSLTDFSGLESKTPYIFRGHKSGIVPLKATGTSDSLIYLSVPPHGWEFFSAIALTEATHTRTLVKFDVAPLGLLSAISGAAAVLRQSVQTAPNGRTQIAVVLKALGILGFYISDLPLHGIDDLLVTLGGSVVPIDTVRINKQEPTVLEVDIETAWNELGLVAGWSNEATVELILP